MKVQIVLKSGASIEFDAVNVASERHPLTGALTSFTWNTPTGRNVTKLHTIELDQVAAIVCKGVRIKE